MSWKSVTFTSQDIRDSKAMRLQEEFAKIFMLRGAPAAAVMYGGADVRNRDICYFTPAAADLAPKLLQSYGAVDCTEPDVRSLAVLVKNSTGGDSD
jgi:hypothetical protein